MESNIGNVAHDLANSMNVISNTVQLLERDLKNDPERPGQLIDQAITTLKNQCSLMEIQFEELRRLSAEPVRGRKKRSPL
jgi:signal transduction histidine kinase